MRVIETSILIQASAKRVWMILTDFDRYVDWNPFMVFAKGVLVLGQPFELHRASHISTVLDYGIVTSIDVDDYRLGWTTCWITSTLFSTVYDFTIEQIDTESVRFVQRETLSGLIPFLLSQRWMNTLESSMISENKALKRLAENKPYRLTHLWIER